MYAKALTLLFACPVLSSAISNGWRTQAHLQKCNGRITPAWKAEDKLTNERLSSKARSGLVPVDVEEGLISSAGTSFANPFYDSIDSYNLKGSCFSECTSIAIKLPPCVWAAVKAEDPKKLLDCGVTKDDICKCTKCLPGKVGQYVQQFCSSAIGDNLEPSETYSYVDFSYVATFDPNVQAFRGDLLRYKLEELERSGAVIQQSPNPANGDFSTMGTCGCPNTCIGLCILNTCTGICV